MSGRLRIVEGDLTQQAVEAIVNAADNALLGGGGVDGAIHLAAGPQLLEECRTLVGCETGAAKITKGYNLAAAWVIHTVGPVWRGGGHRENELLAQCYRSCFTLVEEHSIRTVAFPAISAGVYGFPMDLAARIAISEVRAVLNANSTVEQVVLVCFREPAYRIYLEAGAFLGNDIC